MVYESEEIEELYREDIREKKQTGRGVFHKGNRSKNVSKHSLNTPYSYLSREEKKLLNGEVIVSNMFDTVIPRNEFNALDIDTQKKLLTRWRELYSNKEIMDRMEITSNASFWTILNKLEIPKLRKGTYKRDKKEIKNVDPAPIEPSVELITRGLHLEYNGEYTSDALNRIFTKLQLLTEGEEGKYLVSFQITERVS